MSQGRRCDKCFGPVGEGSICEECGYTQPDPRFSREYNDRCAMRDRLHSAMIEYLDSPEASLDDIALRHGLTQTQLSKQVVMNILPEHRRWSGTGKAPLLEPNDRIKKILLDAAEHGHPYSALTNDISPQMSRYYKHRWRSWLAANGHGSED